MAEDCIFCKILAGEIPSSKVYETENTFAFDDINPKAPVHVLVIPRKHIPSVNDLTEEDAALVGKMILAAREVAKIKGTDESGYRVLFNTNRDAGQLVFHIHLHVLGGHPLGPMG
jgi:histidine triad (HIT) family protein